MSAAQNDEHLLVILMLNYADVCCSKGELVKESVGAPERTVIKASADIAPAV